MLDVKTSFSGEMLDVDSEAKVLKTKQKRFQIIKNFSVRV